MYALKIAPGCFNCGRCSYRLPGWPDKYKTSGLLISQRMLEEKEHDISAVIASCPMDFIELNPVGKTNGH